MFTVEIVYPDEQGRPRIRDHFACADRADAEAHARHHLDLGTYFAQVSQVPIPGPILARIVRHGAVVWALTASERQSERSGASASPSPLPSAPRPARRQSRARSPRVLRR